MAGKRKKKSVARERGCQFTVFFDGCCEPRNPGGTAGFGMVIFEGPEGEWNKVHEASGMIAAHPTTSNNVAEYRAVHLAFDWFLQHGLQDKSIHFYGDSMLVIQQLWGCWKIHKGHYKPAALDAREKLKRFKRCTGSWISRDENSLADDLSKAHLRAAGVEFRIQPEEAHSR